MKKLTFFFCRASTADFVLQHGKFTPTLPGAHSSNGARMLLVGLTGNIGSGKSAVAQLLSERGATIIDADVLARRAVEVGTPVFRAIAERWARRFWRRTDR